MTMPDTPELPPTDEQAILNALNRAFSLGQTYWRQADSESYRENARADETHAKYTALLKETASILASRATRLAAAPQGWKPMHTAPLAGEFLACIEVTHGAGKGPTLWHQHVLMRDDEDGSIHTDYEQGWDLEDYHGWMPLPPAPDAAPAASSPASHPAMFDAFGNPRKRYVRLTVDGSHCVDKPENLTDNIGDMAPGEYTTADVFLSEREFNDLPEFYGF